MNIGYPNFGFPGLPQSGHTEYMEELPYLTLKVEEINIVMLEVSLLVTLKEEDYLEEVILVKAPRL